MSGDLVSLLSETLDELERVARAATDGPWEYDGDAVDVVPSSRGGEYVARYVGDVWGEVKLILPADGEHIARWDPKAVLGLVAAVREMLALNSLVRTVDPSAKDSRYLMALARGFGITEED